MWSRTIKLACGFSTKYNSFSSQKKDMGVVAKKVRDDSLGITAAKFDVHDWCEKPTPSSSFP